MRILVVEDEIRLAALLQRGLQEDGYIVQVATTGPDGLWQATEFDYDAVILDWMLPGMAGPAVCAELRRRGRWAPVIMLTARTAVEDRIEGLDAGADDYLSKPFSYSELTARLRALLRRGTLERDPVLRAGEVAIDPAAQLVTVAGQELSLSAKEYSVLEQLVRNKGSVLSRGRILEHSWDFAYEPSSNVVDQYVGYLRRKIAARTTTVSIVTVRSVGYRLTEHVTVAPPP
jgi:two-component system OmpR family response regulator